MFLVIVFNCYSIIWHVLFYRFYDKYLSIPSSARFFLTILFYSFADVASSISEAKANGIFVSLNYLVFPGVNDTEAELEVLLQFLEKYRPDFIQMRNLSLDPKIAIELFAEDVPCMGLENFLKRIKKSQPSIGIGYFNPFVENGG